MPLFDPTIVPAEGLTSDIIEGVNGVVDRLRAMKVDSLPVAGTVRTHNLVRCYIQAHIRRCITYIEGGHAEFYADRPLVADTCARANYENVAAFCDFANALIPLLEAGDHAAIRKFVEERAFATRIPNHEQARLKALRDTHDEAILSAAASENIKQWKVIPEKERAAEAAARAKELEDGYVAALKNLQSKISDQERSCVSMAPKSGT